MCCLFPEPEKSQLAAPKNSAFMALAPVGAQQLLWKRGHCSLSPGNSGLAAAAAPCCGSRRAVLRFLGGRGFPAPPGEEELLLLPLSLPAALQVDQAQGKVFSAPLPLARLEGKMIQKGKPDRVEGWERNQPVLLQKSLSKQQENTGRGQGGAADKL